MYNRLTAWKTQQISPSSAASAATATAAAAAATAATAATAAAAAIDGVLSRSFMPARATV